MRTPSVESRYRHMLPKRSYCSPNAFDYQIAQAYLSKCDYTPGQIPQFKGGPYHSEDRYHNPVLHLRDLYSACQDNGEGNFSHVVTQLLDAHDSHAEHGAHHMIVTPFAHINPAELFRLFEPREFLDFGHIADPAVFENLIQPTLRNGSGVMLAGTMRGTSVEALNFELYCMHRFQGKVDVYDISRAPLLTAEALQELEARTILQAGYTTFSSLHNTHFFHQDLTSDPAPRGVYDMVIADVLDIYIQPNDRFQETFPGIIQDPLKPGGLVLMRGLEQQNVQAHQLMVNDKTRDNFYEANEDDHQFYRWLSEVGIEIPLEEIVRTRINRFTAPSADPERSRWGKLVPMLKEACRELELVSLVPQVTSEDMTDKRVFLNMVWRKAA